MPQELRIEERLTALEREIAQLKQRLDRIAGRENWLDLVIGSMKDEPDFGEVVKLGAAFRQAQGSADEP